MSKPHTVCLISSQKCSCFHISLLLHIDSFFLLFPDTWHTMASKRVLFTILLLTACSKAQPDDSDVVEAPDKLPAPPPSPLDDCDPELIGFELITGYVFSAPGNVLDSIPGTLMLTDCLETCQGNDSCQSVNYETGLCILFSSNADVLPGKRMRSPPTPIQLCVFPKTYFMGSCARDRILHILTHLIDILVNVFVFS